MSVRSLAAVAGIGLLFLAGCPGEPTDEAIRAKAQEIHQRIITIDTHVDIPVTFATEDVDPGQRGRYRVDLPKMREGGLDVVFFAAYVPQGPRTPEGYARAQDRALTKIHAIRRMAYEMHPDQIDVAYSPADVERIVGEGKLVAVISIENAHALGGDLDMVQEYYDLGVRSAGLTHNGHNDLADSSAPGRGEPAEEHGGLSDMGREYVEKLNRLGVIIDVSHASKAATLETMELSRAPLIASHSGVKEIADHRRNLDDEELFALKENGGVIHIVALGGFLKIQPPERRQAMNDLRQRFEITRAADVAALSEEQRAAYDEGLQTIQTRWPAPDIGDFVDHIDYVVNLIGVDHVGIGSDFDGGGGVPGFDDASECPNVTEELVRRGYSEEDIRKIWGENLMRVWRENERVAQEMQAEEAGA